MFAPALCSRWKTAYENVHIYKGNNPNNPEDPKVYIHIYMNKLLLFIIKTFDQLSYVERVHTVKYFL